MIRQRILGSVENTAPYLLPALLALLLLLWPTVLWRPRPLPGVERRRPLLLGHRGVRFGEGRVEPRENTLAAFQLALEAGLDGVECDVQQTADGELVLFHDRDLAGRTVTLTAFPQLRGLDPQLTRLDELLQLVARHPGSLLNVEIKLYSIRGRGIEGKVARLISSRGLEERTIVSSFQPLALARLRLQAPRVRTALLFAPQLPPLLASGSLAGWLHVDALHPHHGQVDQGLIERAKARGLMVNAWTVNEPEEVARLASLGASGIIGDDPQALQRAAGR